MIKTDDTRNISNHSPLLLILIPNHKILNLLAILYQLGNLTGVDFFRETYHYILYDFCAEHGSISDFGFFEEEGSVIKFVE